MTTTRKNDLLFDDFAILKEFVGPQHLNLSSPTTDCDCIGYATPRSDDNVNTTQVAQSAGQTA